ncbi:MAG: SAM-dependent chlorinase/fluorinase [Anaerolineae bacterium]
MSTPIITLTTDFGQSDSYVGAMKGVILSLCPEATLVDICHEIHPQAVRQAAYVLSTAIPYFPPGTVHLVVVDPGVGSQRRPIVVQSGRALYVAPDNGVLSFGLRQDPPQLAIHLTEPTYRLSRISATFHGRDIFAPAAAHLACGSAPSEMGEPISLSDLCTLPTIEPQQQADGTWLGEILHIDRFGNLITNFQSPEPQSTFAVMVAEQRIDTLSRTFAAVGPGELVAYVGSTDYLEIAVREGNAAHWLQLDVGDPVQVIGLP